MTNIPFVLYKDRDGWTARSRIELEPHGLEAGRVLDVMTYKGPRGGIWTNVRCGKVEDRCFSFMLFQDFSKTVCEDRKARCTEKAVQTMHQAALAQADAIVAECVAAYTQKEAA